MISLGNVASAGGAASYYAADNYYTVEEGSEASVWMGEGASDLGLNGRVDEKSFASVLSGELPNGSVIDAKRGDRRPGLDLTFSVSKSVSLIALLGKDPRIVEALKESVVATLRWVEKNLVETRVWNGKEQRPEKTEKLVAATFLHDVNRNGEPQLHVHAVIANATMGADGKWRALKNDALYGGQHVIGAVHNADLRMRIEALGYSTEPAPNTIDGSFEIVGISREAVIAFSTRTTAIAAVIKAEGRGSPREREIAALATRPAKAPEISAEARMEGWERGAATVGLDVRSVVARALERSAGQETSWSRLIAEVRGIGAQGLAIAARMGLTPRDGDSLVPERVGRLDPVSWAAAQAVASASRDLSQREAAYTRFELIGGALQRCGPITVDRVEARIALLESKGLLISDGDRLLTTEAAVKLEKHMLAQSRLGNGKVTAISSPSEASARAQETAREQGLRRLSPRQAAAASLVLSSTDRVVIIQGVAGAGKSAVLKPVAEIARQEGRAVIGLAIANKVSRDLMIETGAKTQTVAGFLGRNTRILDGTASPRQLAGARDALRGALVMVDESSMVGTTQMVQLIELANKLDIGRLALIGDTRQLGAVDAGKPFEELQKTGAAMAEMPDNLRAKSDMMKATVAALNRDDLSGAFAALKPVTIEAGKGDVPQIAAEMWTDLSPQERDQTLLLASGRGMRGAANAAVQDILRDRGELAGTALKLDVLDQVTVSREGAREMRAYRQGHVVDFRTDLKSQGIGRGERGVVMSADRGTVVLEMRDGQMRLFTPGKLPANLRQDAVSIYAIKSIELYAGDRIRWTANDKTRDLLNSDLARVEAITPRGVTVSSLVDGTVHDIARSDPMLERLDLAYAINVHVAQGVTTQNGIVMMVASERMLASNKSFLVAMTRIADKATLIVDYGPRLEQAIGRNLGTKTSALDVTPRTSGVGTRGTAAVIPLPEKSKGLEL